MALRTHITKQDILGMNNCCWTEEQLHAVYGDSGISTVEVLAHTGATRIEKLWTVTRFFVLEDSLWSFLADLLKRVNVVHPKSTPVITMLEQAGLGNLPSMDNLNVARRDSKVPFPLDFVGENKYNHARVYTPHQAIMSLGDHLRGRVDRSSIYAIRTVDIIANRVGVPDPEIESQWMLDRILDYYEGRA